MSNLCFGDFHEVTCRDDLRPALTYGIVFGGRMVCTNAHIMVCNSLSLWLEDNRSEGRELLTIEEQLENVEGKAFSTKLLKNLTHSRIKFLRFEKDEILAFDNKGLFKKFYYSGVSFDKLGYQPLDKEPKDKFKRHLYSPTKSFQYIFQLINEVTGELQNVKKDKETDPDSPDYFSYPLFKEAFGSAVINKDTMEFNFNKFVIPNTPFKFINTEFLYKISKTFRNASSNVIFGNVHNSAKKPAFVFPNEREYSPLGVPYGDEFGIIMPIINTTFNY